ncbi:hypothetical protein EVAR_74286_1 [Eumeta japonica]|uniref:Uncharacterized protein n=1 Tax=Eumeta variegata TaxID=151549 RepID=A0A4C1SFP1_EUMVA|nr:hypothetical protein EVAR_74286_1 [Eumeta japonica]
MPKRAPPQTFCFRLRLSDLTKSSALIHCALWAVDNSRADAATTGTGGLTRPPRHDSEWSNSTQVQKTPLASPSVGLEPRRFRFEGDALSRRDTAALDVNLLRVFSFFHK